MLETWSKWSLAALVAGLAGAASVPSDALAQNARAGRVVGNIDGISHDGGEAYVLGWACQQGNPASIEVHIYADRSAFDKPPGAFVTAGKAELESEPAVGQACQDPKGGKHRFKIELSNQRQERVDLRVLPVIFRFEKKDAPVYPGQLVDVYIGQQ